jgi:hypothetical protein
VPHLCQKRSVKLISACPLHGTPEPTKPFPAVGTSSETLEVEDLHGLYFYTLQAWNIDSNENEREDMRHRPPMKQSIYTL